jgi:hypothetical protein
MPYYKNVNLLFIHIPKTGGTVVENQIKKKYNEQLYSEKNNSILPKPYNNYSLQHQFYKTIFEHKKILNVNFNNIKVFTIIRNPYDRIISDLFWYELINENSSPDEVYSIIKNKYLYRNDLDNHNTPQYLYITNDDGDIYENIKIFRTEELNIKNNELNKFLGFNINIIKNNVNKDYSKYLNDNSIAIIESFYAKDFEIFGYSKKTKKI